MERGTFTPPRAKALHKSTTQMTTDLLRAPHPAQAIESWLKNKHPSEKEALRMSLFLRLGQEAAKAGLPFKYYDFLRENMVLDQYHMRQLRMHVIGQLPSFGDIQTNLRNQCRFFERVLKKEGDTFVLHEMPAGPGQAPLRAYLQRTPRGVERVIETTSLHGIQFRDVVWFDEKGEIHIEKAHTP